MNVSDFEKKYNYIKTKAFFEQHFHGAFGINFNTATIDEILFLCKEIVKYGITTIVPTLATDSVENIKQQIKRIEEAKKNLPQTSAKIFGIHLEAIFLNPEKSGIHDKSQLILPSIEFYKENFDSDLIKVVTLAPELDSNNELTQYLLSKEIKVSAGHCLDEKLEYVNQVTHIFNAMNGIHHRKKTTSLTALTNENKYIEIIADGQHIQDDLLKLIFNVKNKEKILLVSDSIPLAKSNLNSLIFCNHEIFNKGGKAVDKNGIMAGSVSFLNDIVKRLVTNKIVSFDDAIKMSSLNQEKYHNCSSDDFIFWDENFDIKAVFINDIQVV